MITNMDQFFREWEAMKRWHEKQKSREWRQAFVGCKLTHSVNLSIASSGALPGIAHNFDTEIYDIGILGIPMHDTAVNNPRITIPKNGYYKVSFTIFMAANVTGTRFVSVRKNGAGNLLLGDQESPAHGQTVALSNSDTVKLVAGDYIELMIFQNSGIALNSEARPDYAALFSCDIVS